MGRALSLTLWSGAVHAQAYGSESFEGLVREVAETRQRKGNMEELQARLDNPRAKGSLAVTVEWQRRLRTVLGYIAAAKPHIITLQEVDHMASLQFELAKLGYACGEEGKLYTPAHAWAGTRPEKRDDFTQFNRDHGRFLRHLEAVGVAFVPKTQSNCRAFGLRDGHADADDDGVAIFWRTDAFELTELSFLCVNDEKRMQGVVRTRLRRKADGASLAVICTHLSSGTKSADEIVRMKELTEPTLGTGGEPTEPSLVRWFEESAQSSATLLCLDANTRPDQREEAADEATVWKTLRSDPRRGQLMRSVWDKWFDADGKANPKTEGGMPVTTNKMRGPLSSRECSHLDPSRPAPPSVLAPTSATHGRDAQRPRRSASTPTAWWTTSSFRAPSKWRRKQEAGTRGVRRRTHRPRRRWGICCPRWTCRATTCRSWWTSSCPPSRIAFVCCWRLATRTRRRLMWRSCASC